MSAARTSPRSREPAIDASLEIAADGIFMVSIGDSRLWGLLIQVAQLAGDFLDMLRHLKRQFAAAGCREVGPVAKVGVVIVASVIGGLVSSLAPGDRKSVV